MRGSVRLHGRLVEMGPLKSNFKREFGYIGGQPILWVNTEGTLFNYTNLDSVETKRQTPD